MRIFTCEEPELKAKCDEVDLSNSKETAAIVKSAKDAAILMYDTKGCGIAAPQFGENKRFCVIDVSYDEDDETTRKPMIMLNPKVISSSNKKDSQPEGCLSVPGVNIVIERPESIVFEFFDEQGKKHVEEADGLLARCVQHEIDHLDGITMIERAKGIRRVRALASYRAARQQGIKPGMPAKYLVK